MQGHGSLAPPGHTNASRGARGTRTSRPSGARSVSVQSGKRDSVYTDMVYRQALVHMGDRTSASKHRRAMRMLNRQYQELQSNALDGISGGLIEPDNFFRWCVILQGPADTPYEGGLFKAELTFPQDFPDNPPKMRFISKMCHPNVYTDGTVCISILHDAGDDPYSTETADLRWRPIHTVRSILVSVLSLLAEPNIDSPADIDAAKLFRDDKRKWRREVRKTVRLSLEAAL
ncbi:hypothetical protein KIPB_003231 [Kipferlia bialata]|uniref:UBC core domain-containing protein n=1 Tax=Kipferlia bialata TaxID=797122 RepID=A0A9K3CTL1_9EUKA|nr:hypothetical protein KIPB_003231 [Kipferlia bialata]|eukprot:g3231.t1